MKFSAIAYTAIAAFASGAAAKNILLTNDDGWASTGIRATYRALKEDGHNVYLVAPVEQRSGFGGTFTFSYTNTLLHDDQFHYKVEGDPAWGHEESDDHIWYFNATPAACVSFGLDYLLPTYFSNVTIDMVVSGPNQGWNLDDSTFTISGTIGATYNSVLRGYPAIAFSGANTNNSFFKDSLNDSPTDVQNIYASKIVDLVDTLFANQGDNESPLPLAVGLNVNLPKVSTDSSTNCTNPKYVFTRLTGQDVGVTAVKYNATTNLFSSTSVSGSASTANDYNGDFSLHSEDFVIDLGCYSTVSAFSVDYDAPLLQTSQVRHSIKDLLVTI